MSTISPDACVFLMDPYSDEAHVNIGTGRTSQSPIIARLVPDIVGFRWSLAVRSLEAERHAAQAPGCPARLTALGWCARTDLLDRHWTGPIAGPSSIRRLAVQPSRARVKSRSATAECRQTSRGSQPEVPIGLTIRAILSCVVERHLPEWDGRCAVDNPTIQLFRKLLSRRVRLQLPVLQRTSTRAILVWQE